MLRITSKSGETLEVSQEIRKMSRLVDDSLMESAENAEISCGDLESKFVKLLIDYCKHYNFEKTESDIVCPLVSKDPAVFVKDEWERAFIVALNNDEQCELLMAANYFNIPALFELCAANVAAYFKGKDFDKIKGEYGLADVVYTPESEEQLKKDHPWIMEPYVDPKKKAAEESKKL